MAIWNKLVRDRIPEIIHSSGLSATTRVLSQTEYVEALKAKLLEEVEELGQASTRKSIAAEAADVMEVLAALCDSYGLSTNDVAEVQNAKRDERGGFRQRILLIETQDPGAG